MTSPEVRPVYVIHHNSVMKRVGSSGWEQVMTVDELHDLVQFSSLRMIGRERRRQVDWGYTAEHDRKHEPNALAQAAVRYLIPDKWRNAPSFFSLLRILWPWNEPGFKPSPEDRMRELVRGASLAAAEIDRLSEVPKKDEGES